MEQLPEQGPILIIYHMITNAYAWRKDAFNNTITIFVKWNFKRFIPHVNSMYCLNSHEFPFLFTCLKYFLCVVNSKLLLFMYLFYCGFLDSFLLDPWHLLAKKRKVHNILYNFSLHLVLPWTHIHSFFFCKKQKKKICFKNIEHVNLLEEENGLFWSHLHPRRLCMEIGIGR
jgi:hypothetical protein